MNEPMLTQVLSIYSGPIGVLNFALTLWAFGTGIQILLGFLPRPIWTSKRIVDEQAREEAAREEALKQIMRPYDRGRR